jgi:Arc/MetJ-type ribon-helix-helix transcriptional regulator
MTINVSPEVEQSILAAVQSGRFLSVDEAITAAWLELSKKQNAARPSQADEADATPDPLLGIWQDYAEEMDEIVADAYRHRREDKWRDLDL